MRTDIVRLYKDIHTWTGIVAGLALFIAFYAGAITMFETELQRWATVPSELAPPPALEQTDALVAATLAEVPEAGRRFMVNIDPTPEAPARVTWETGGRRGHGILDEARHFGASFDETGNLQVAEFRKTDVAQLVDVLHQQVGLPFDHEISMMIMGAISLLYALALVSGTIVLIPSLIKDLFLVRVGRNLKRMWLDVHNVLGIFSLPFHLVMALTAVVFAFHDQIYDLQSEVIYDGEIEKYWAAGSPRPTPHPDGTPLLGAAAMLARIGEQAPDFRVMTLSYAQQRNGQYMVQAYGTDIRHGVRTPTTGIGIVDAYDGSFIRTNLVPGEQDGWNATLTAFFALHFGSFGGYSVRWGYFFLGLAGAFLFYSGNLLWIESRRKKARKAGQVEQKRSTRVMAALTVGVSFGCIAGISLTIAAAKWLPMLVDNAGPWHIGLYYALFLAAVAWAFVRGAARAGVDLLLLCAATTALIPLSSLLASLTPAHMPWNHGGTDGLLVDLVAVAGTVFFALMALRAHRRVTEGPTDSVWAAQAPDLKPAE
ncbi:MAG: PepSY domain-containing protein [Alphaproteobacteria bacterium]|nr:MAG: PepSY domain-containing protein [Alphaproteobacteria bacterium]